jgi:cardiolipin synthase
LKCEIGIAEYQPTMYHYKIFIVDSLLVSVGSTNFDNHSFRLNDEANLNILDEAFAKKQKEIFEEDWSNARQITYLEWINRPLKEKVIEKLAALFKSQL